MYNEKVKGADMKKTHLIIIDPQVDFCLPEGALYVRGADKDMERLAGFIGTHGCRIDEIHVTLDTHHFLDIAHPVFWKDSTGGHPPPFTVITVSDVENGKWAPTAPSAHSRVLQYVRTLEANGRYALCIWPPHCLMGSPGACVHPGVHSQLLAWEERRATPVDFVAKGSNRWTEHYSAVMAEVIDPGDPGTSLNTGLIEALQGAGRVLVAGEALSHCVANTVTDIADNFGEKNIKKLVLLEDCSSPVAGFEKLGADFVERMVKRGMKVKTASNV